MKCNIGDLVDSISITKKLDGVNGIIFLNTSDVLDGKILKSSYSDINSLPGQAKKSILNSDILFSEIRPQNKRYAFIDIEDTSNYIVSTKLMVLRTKSQKIISKYFYYYLTSREMLDYLQRQAESRSGTFPQITFQEIAKLEMDVPSIEKQKGIIKMISDLDSKIELNNQIINTLEEIIATVFNHWFVDFEFPDKNGNQYKSSGGKMIESELVEIPEEFQLVELGNIIENIKDKILVEDLSLDNYASTENLLAGKLGKMQATKLPTVKSVKCYRNDDILISNIRPYFKKIWKAVGKGGYSNDVLNFRAKRAICLPEFLYSFLQRDDFFEFMTLTSKGTKMPRGDKQAIATLKLALPNMKMMLCYSEKTIPLFNMINQRKSENETLKELRDTLLPKLLSVEIELE